MAFVKDMITVFSGDFVRGLSAIVVNIVVSRYLGVEKFGLFATVASILLVASLLADFGLGPSLVRFASLYRQRDREMTENITAIAFRLMLLAAALVALSIFLLAEPLAGLLFNHQQSASLIRLAAIGIFGSAITLGTMAVFQSREAFKKYTLINVAIAGSKIIMIVLLLTTGLLTLNSAVLVLAVAPFFAFAVGLFLTRRNNPLRHKDLRVPKKIVLDFLHFSKWVILSYFLVAIIPRIDIFMLAYLKGSRTVGLYAAALQLSMVTLILVGSVNRVVLPKVSKFVRREEYISFIKKALILVAASCLLLSPALLFAKQIVLLVFGAKYVGSIGQFQILFLVFLFVPLFQPITLLVYALGKPVVMTLTHFTQLVISIAGNLILIPLYGGYGAAINLLVINVIGTGFLLGYILIKVRGSESMILKEELQFDG